MTKPSRRVNASLVGTLTLTGVATGLASGAVAQSHDMNMAPSHAIVLAQTEDGEGGEGGEGGSIAEVSPAVGYLTALGLIEGHLRSGIALYRGGMTEMAETHMKHPKDEIYTALRPGLTARDVRGFDAKLAALADAVEGGAPVETANAAFEDLLTKLAEARAAATDASPRDRFKAIEAMVRTAADEYEIGVKMGEIVNMHEYQDAKGFTEAARALAEQMTGNPDANVAATAEEVLIALEPVPSVFPGIAPQSRVADNADVLYGAAARIELASLSVK